MMLMEGKITVTCEMGYAENAMENDYFPQTLVFVEGDKGTAEVARDYWVRVTTKLGTQAKRVAPVHYPWADPSYDVVHASIVPCNANLLQGLSGQGRAETTADDNYQTLRLVFAAYDSARAHQTIQLQPNQFP
jgi:D-apiose dehydrogenase